MLTLADEEDRKMGDLGSDDADQLDRNMWAPEEEEDGKEVLSSEH